MKVVMAKKTKFEIDEYPNEVSGTSSKVNSKPSSTEI